MQIEPKNLAARDAYRLVTSCVIPRPIGWVSTLDGAGNANLAPFSFFGAISSKPFLVMLSVGRRRGQRKDTANNLLAAGEAVIHIPHRPLAEQMVATSAEVEAEVDEFDLAGLQKLPATRVAPPRVAEAAVALEAKLIQHQEVGDGPVDLFLLEVVWVHLADTFLSEGVPDPQRLAAVGRLGDAFYSDTAATFAIQRPR